MERRGSSGNRCAVMPGKRAAKDRCAPPHNCFTGSNGTAVLPMLAESGKQGMRAWGLTDCPKSCRLHLRTSKEVGWGAAESRRV